MTDSVNPTSKPRGVLSARRLALLATAVAGLGAAAVVLRARRLGALEFPAGAQAQNLSQQAQTAQRPVGFADIVERVKPAVISVRVRVDAPAREHAERAVPAGLADGPFLPPLGRA